MKEIEKFNPKKHICKFGFELYDYATLNSERYNILCDLYQRELVFEFINKRTEEVTEAIGFKLNKSEINSLLPLIIWDEYEKIRDVSYDAGLQGYRDGWGYKFWCLSESGDPILQIYMDYLFDENNLPPYEKLLSWICENYKYKKSLKNKDMLWL